SSIERTGIDALARPTLDKVNKMPAIGKKLRESVAQLSGFASCDGHGLAARGGYFPKSSQDIGSEQGRSVPIPGPSSARIGVGQHLQPAACDADAFPFPIRKESDRRPIGRPEWIACSIRSH